MGGIVGFIGLVGIVGGVVLMFITGTVDDKFDTIAWRALGSGGVSARLGRSLADSQVVLGDIPGGSDRRASALRC